MSVFHERAARCRAVLEREGASVTVRTVAGRLLRANTERADTYLPVNVPTVRLEGSAGLRPNTGKQARHAAAPDPIEGSRHAVKRGRTKRGPTAVVKRYGLAHVIGSFYGPPVDHDNGAESVPALAEVLEALGHLKRGAYGVSALDVYRLTQRLYGEVIPPLLSTDNDQHHAVLHGDDSDTDDYGVAWHNPSDPYAACDSQGRTVPDSVITYPRRGYGLTYGLPTECVTDRWKLALWLASKRETSSADAGRIMARRVRTGPENVKRPSTRFALRRASKRAGDAVDRWEALHNGYGAVAAVMLGHAAYRWHLIGPSADREHVWQGHAFLTRPVPKNGATVQGKRTRQTVKRRTVDHVQATDYATLLARFATVGIGQRVTWQCLGHEGTFTRAADGRYSVGRDGAPLVKSVRTMDAVRIKLERAA